MAKEKYSSRTGDKPPLSKGRISGQIAAGVAVEAAAAALGWWVLYSFCTRINCMGEMFAFAFFIMLAPLVLPICGGLVIYLVGRSREYTASLAATLGSGFFGALFSFYIFFAFTWLVGLDNLALTGLTGSGVGIVMIAICSTIGFNLTRRFRSSADS